MLSRLFRSRDVAPRLSVVLPAYNVAGYLSECLDSLLAQEFTDLEILVVDDGSTDRSAAIASDYVRRHAHIRLMQTDNHGLGAARNTGAKHVSGELLAFVDSDDTVPSYAYALMVAALDESGSDLVVGSVLQQFEATGELVEPVFLRRVHGERRLGTTVEDFPQVIHNVFAWDKIFRRSFWDKEQLSFPEGVRYEDQPTMVEAYLRARAIDVLRRPVYHWRVRGDDSSITQRRHEVDDLRDRITTKAMTTQIVRSIGSPSVLDYWARAGLPGDLPVYLQEVPGCDDTYWEVLRDGIRRVFDGLPPIEESRLRVVHRVAGWLVSQDRRADAEEVLEWVAQHPSGLPLRVDGDHVVALLPLAERPDTGIAPQLFWLAEHELEFDARLVDVRWEGTALVVVGWAIIRGAPTPGSATEIRVALRSVDADGHRVISFDVSRFEAPEATAWVARDRQVYDDSGFVARFDLAEAPPATYAVHIEIDVAEIRRAGGFLSKEPGLDLTALAGAGPPDVTFTPVEGLRVLCTP